MNSQIEQWRKAAGLVLFWMGTPAFFFLRSFFIPASLYSISTFGYLLFCISLLFTKDIFTQKIKINNTLGFIFLPFFIITTVYLIFYPLSLTGNFREKVTTVLIFIFGYFVFKSKFDLENKVFPLIVLLTFFINLILIYSFMKNLNLGIGGRASVQYDEEGGSNPLVYSLNAFYGFIASYLIAFSKSRKSLYWFVFSLINLLISLVALVVTQGRLTFLVLILCLPLLIVNFDKKLVKKVFRFKFIFYFILFLVFINWYFGGQFFLTLYNYYNSYYSLVLKVINTILGNQNMGIDSSANTRIELISYAVNDILRHPYKLIFGNGYRSYYLDVPLLQVLYDFGIGGLINIILFLSVNIYYVFTGYLRQSLFFKFLFFVTLYFMADYLTHGIPMSIAFLTIYIILIKFSGTNLNEDSIST